MELQDLLASEERGEVAPRALITAGFLLLVAWLFWPKPVDYGAVEVLVFDAVSDVPVDGAGVLLSDFNVPVASRISKAGVAQFDNAPLKKLVLTVKQRGFGELQKEIDATQKREFAVRLRPLSKFSNVQPLEDVLPPAGEAVKLQAEGIAYCGDGSASEKEECDTDAACKNGFQCSSDCACVPEERDKTRVLSAVDANLSRGEKTGVGDFELQVTDIAPASAMIRVFEKTADASGLQFLSVGQSWKTRGFLATLQAVSGGKAAFRLALVEEVAGVEFNALVTSPVNGSVESRMVFEIKGAASAPGGVQSVEVSFNGGGSWKKALGAGEWTYRGVAADGGWRNVSVRVKSFSGAVSDAFILARVFFSACKLLIGNAPQAKAIDVVVIPSKFVSLFGFKENIDDAATELLAQPVFASNPALREKINFYYYAANVECRIAGSEPPADRMWTCDLPDNFFAACSFADVSAVLVNSTTYGGTSGNPFIQTAGKPRVFVHEAGHALFNLADRYCCDGAYWEDSPYQNLWRGVAVCSLQTSIETGGGACRQIGDTGWSEMSTESVMQKIEFDFDQREEQRIKWVLENYEK